MGHHSSAWISGYAVVMKASEECCCVTQVISKVTAKMLLLGAKNDNINRYPQLQAAYKRVKGGLATLLTLDANHFACYNAPITDITYPAMLKFLNETLA